jgi:hypothetical protein
VLGDEARYESEMRDKLQTVVEAGKQNRGFYNELRIQTTGSDPSACVVISASLLEKFLRPRQ